jgi:prepilin-type N-terminal cleavage/methylation domain-containing protein
MPSTDRRRRSCQSGVTLVESLVASALLGITAIVAITAWDTAIGGARTASSQAWAHCVARVEMEAVLTSTSPPPSMSQVSVTVSPDPDSSLELITVSVTDATSQQTIYVLRALRARVLAGGPQVSSGQLATACPTP